MSPEGTFQAFRSALKRQAWNEAAELVHPAYARDQQERHVALLGAYFASDHRSDPAGATAHVLVIKGGADFSPYYARRVETFPGKPSLGELAAMKPQEYLARAMAATESPRLGVRNVPAYVLPVEILRVSEDGSRAQVDLRLPELEVEDDAEAFLEVQLRKCGAEWRVLPWPGEFMPPTPWEAS
jgi:hypothetical protein